MHPGFATASRYTKPVELRRDLAKGPFTPSALPYFLDDRLLGVVSHIFAPVPFAISVDCLAVEAKSVFGVPQVPHPAAAAAS